MKLGPGSKKIGQLFSQFYYISLLLLCKVLRQGNKDLCNHSRWIEQMAYIFAKRSG